MLFDRRSFLKGALLSGTAAGVAATGLLAGCASPQPASPDTLSDTGSATGDNVEARAASLVEREADIATKVSNSLECDILVLGAGGSGLAAAIRGAELGAKVLVVEKGTEPGGTTVGTEGMFGWGSKLQSDNNIDLPSVAELIDEENVYTNYRTDAVLWKNFITSSGKTADWLMENGYAFDRVDIYKGKVSSFKCFHWWADQSGQTLIDFLHGKAQEMGIEILTQSPAVCLKKAEDTVIGAYIHNLADDTYAEVTAKAVIAGCGGYAMNPRLIEQLTSWDMTYANNKATGTGDGVIMGEDVGAGTYMTAILPAIHVYGYDASDPIVIGCCNQPLLFLNQDGNRCMDESLFIRAHKALFVNAILSQKQCYCIFDQATVDRFETGDGIFAAWRTFKVGSNIEDFQKQIDECIAKDMGNAFVADTIEQLASAIGIDAASMQASIERYNGFCATGTDEDFLKESEYLNPVQSGPFYAIRLDPSVTNTIGGLDVNYHNQVVTAEGAPISGLYCVGVDGNKLYKETYNYGLSGGLVSFALYSGLTAAQHAYETCVA